MSAPRKIWAQSEHVDDPAYGSFWTRYKVAPAVAYHHNDVVRELVAALEECRDEIDRYIRQEYPFDHPVQERYRQRDFSANPARIALAKIAREDQP